MNIYQKCVICIGMILLFGFLFSPKTPKLSPQPRKQPFVKKLPASPIMAGVPQSFTIESYSTGNVWNVRFVGPVLVSSTCVTDMGNGQYKVEYVLPQPGIYNVDIDLLYDHVNVSSPCSSWDVMQAFKRCNPKSKFHTRIDGLNGCGHNKWGSQECVSSTQQYTKCMDEIRDRCNFPRLIKQPIAVLAPIIVKGMGFLAAATTRPCAERAEALGKGFWVDTNVACERFGDLGFNSKLQCQDAIFPCSSIEAGDNLTAAVCKAPLRWRPERCVLRPVPPTEVIGKRKIVMYGISTTAEVNLVMGWYYPGLSTLQGVVSNSTLLKKHQYMIDWHSPDTTFLLTACGTLLAPGLTTEANFYQNINANKSVSCRVFLQQIRSARKTSKVDIIYDRHPVTYPRKITTPTDWENSFGRFSGTRGYMSVNELLTDFHDVIMTRFIGANVPINGILDGYSLTSPLRHSYGDALHYNFPNVRFVLETKCLLLVNAISLPTALFSPAAYDPNLNKCPFEPLS